MAPPEEKQQDTPSANEELSFEKALEKLEALVNQMESGDLSLDDNIKAFEEGMKLAAFCNEKLGETEKKVEILMKRGGENAQWQDMDIPGEEGGGDAER